MAGGAAVLRHRLDLNRVSLGTEPARHPADQMSGVGEDHLQQGLQVLPFPLQFGVAGQG